jgi:hypothetical protein
MQTNTNNCISNVTIETIENLINIYIQEKLSNIDINKPNLKQIWENYLDIYVSKFIHILQQLHHVCNDNNNIEHDIDPNMIRLLYLMHTL